jgi:hypothetical protein
MGDFMLKNQCFRNYEYIDIKAPVFGAASERLKMPANATELLALALPCCGVFAHQLSVERPDNDAGRGVIREILSYPGHKHIQAVLKSNQGKKVYYRPDEPGNKPLEFYFA